MLIKFTAMDKFFTLLLESNAITNYGSVLNSIGGKELRQILKKLSKDEYIQIMPMLRKFGMTFFSYRGVRVPSVLIITTYEGTTKIGTSGEQLLQIPTIPTWNDNQSYREVCGIKCNDGEYYINPNY